MIQLPLTFLRTYDVTLSRFVTHFKILNKSKRKNFILFLILHKLGLLYFYQMKFSVIGHRNNF